MRGDLPFGKAAAQAIHAALDSFHRSSLKRRSAFMARGHGPVIVLTAPDEACLRRTCALATEAGLPAAEFEDENEAGRLSITAIGIGPLDPAEGRSITGRFPLMK